MEVVHIFTCSPVLVFSKQANVHCRYSFSLLSACVLCSSRGFSRDIENYFGLSAAVAADGSYDHIWFVVFRRICIVTKSE